VTATITITFEGDHIRAESRAEKSIEWAREFWTAIVDACKENDCYDILGISESITVVPIMDGFDHIELFRELGITTKYRIAWVELNPAAIKTLKFVDAALFNRILPGRLFQTEEEAKSWLFGKKVIERLERQSIPAPEGTLRRTPAAHRQARPPANLELR
jgi:hypothetical protein